MSRQVPLWAVVLIAFVVAALAGLAFMLSGGDDATRTPAADPASATPTVYEVDTAKALATTVEQPKVTLSASAPASVQGKRAVIQIETNGTEVEVSGRSFTGGAQEIAVRLPLVGPNNFIIAATAPGMGRAVEIVTIVRVLSAAEKAQKAAAAKERREKRAAEIRQKYVDQAESIDYDQLVKNPDAHAGEIVTYTGQILQIEDASSLMLVYVTDLGYGIWSDLVWVNYPPGSVKGAADDIVTFWGRVVGGRSYETQIGGENFVPEVDARYVDG